MAEAAAGEPDCAGDDFQGDVVIEVRCLRLQAHRYNVEQRADTRRFKRCTRWPPGLPHARVRCSASAEFAHLLMHAVSWRRRRRLVPLVTSHAPAV